MNWTVVEMAYVIGVDIGGSKIKGVLANYYGKPIKSYARPTEAHKSRKQILSNILKVIDCLKVAHVQAIGISSPGFALPNGKMACLPNIRKLEGFRLKDEIEKKTKVRVVLDNDANCFALAEQRRGAAKGYKNAIGVIIGTGVGTGIIINGEVYRGAIGGAGEAGHTKLVVHHDIHDVEDLISGPAIVKRYNHLSGKKAKSPKIMMDRRDKAAKQAYDEFVFFSGMFFSNLIDIFNPGIIVVGGGVSNLPFYKDAEKIVAKLAQPELMKACKIRKNLLGDDSGALGAVELALDELKK
jgi:predicted NBD/HSP70 family sugar kinase